MTSVCPTPMVLGMHATLGKLGICHAGVCAAAGRSGLDMVAIDSAKRTHIKVAINFLRNAIIFCFFLPSNI